MTGSPTQVPGTPVALDTWKTLDGNAAAVDVAYRLSEVAAIYPITPSSPMGELADEWAGKGRTNLWGTVPRIAEMQSEGGAAGAIHGAATTGSLATTFTASQGLLLMIPNMYKLAGELTPFVMHVAARTLATHALSIFCDHSDVMGVRQTGFAMLSSTSVQEAHDMAAVSHAATLESRVPFLHFFDGFRTSHELNKISVLSDEQLAALIDDDAIDRHRKRALTPDSPSVRGTAYNPDAYFQAREACNPFYDACPRVVADVLERFGKISGRNYQPIEYYGHPEADRVIIAMGSAIETITETARHLNDQGERVGVIAVRLYRPFSSEFLARALPGTAKKIAVLDRTKEPGAPGEPLYLDVLSSLHSMHSAGALPTGQMPEVISGRYGLSSKEFMPRDVKAVYDELTKDSPKRVFTVGINDDVTRLSLTSGERLNVDSDGTLSAVFFGLGSDGTVGANKNTIKILGDDPDRHVQGYFVYDSKKSGSWTISHLRFSDEPIRAPYLIEKADFVACHQFTFLDRRDILEIAKPGATFLVNSPYSADEVWDHLPKEAQQRLIDEKISMHVIDATRVAHDAGLGHRINTVMQTCFFLVSGVLEREQAIEQIKDAIRKTYGKLGDVVIQRNIAAVDASLENLHEVTIPGSVSATHEIDTPIAEDAPDFVKRVTAMMMAGKGDQLPVSAFPPDGTWPTATTQYERRSIATEIPIWDESICIQCNKCSLICPHAAIRAKAYDEESLGGSPDCFKSMDYKAKDLRGLKFTIQVAPDDCTGCNLCVNICPAKNKQDPKRKAINMEPKLPHLEDERAAFEHFLDIPQLDRERIVRLDVKGTQLLRPLFEYSGACAGCGETPYVKLLTQLFGDRLLVANATGCSSIYGGNLPATPYCVDDDGRGPAWANSLFEDNAEFGFGFKLSTGALTDVAKHLLREVASEHNGAVGDELVDGLLDAVQNSEQGIRAQRERVAGLRERLAAIDSPIAGRLNVVADYLVRKSHWLVGGDGWAFDIGYGGLDHVLAQPDDINILVLDTEVYSNTGGQASKATPLGASAKFAATGKVTDKKDLGLMAMHYGHVYVASVAMGAKDTQTVQAFQEAESYEGPSLIIAYSHCIAHGYDMAFGADQQKRAVESGVWPLYRYDPRRVAQGQPPLIIDAPAGKIPVTDYLKNEARFRMVERLDPERYKAFSKQTQRYAEQRIAVYKHMAELRLNGKPKQQSSEEN